ncbi:pleckstrin homology-like domain, family B, member 1, isoform CRA_c, partial [Mus musculus]
GQGLLRSKAELLRSVSKRKEERLAVLDSQAGQIRAQAVQESERLAREKNAALQLLQKEEKEKLNVLERRYHSLTGGRPFPKTTSTLKEMEKLLLPAVDLEQWYQELMSGLGTGLAAASPRSSPPPLPAKASRQLQQVYRSKMDSDAASPLPRTRSGRVLCSPRMAPVAFLATWQPHCRTLRPSASWPYSKRGTPSDRGATEET